MDLVDPILLYLALLLLILLELALSASFFKPYYTVGLPIFRSRQPAAPGTCGPPWSGPFRAELASPPDPTFIFHAFDESRFGFRESIWTVSARDFWGKRVDRSRSGFGERLWLALSANIHFPIMHGLLCFDADSRSVRIVGFLNWAPVAFVGVVTFTACCRLKESGFELVLVLLPTLGIVAGTYARQAKRFSTVAETAAAAWGSAALEQTVG